MRPLVARMIVCLLFLFFCLALAVPSVSVVGFSFVGDCFFVVVLIVCCSCCIAFLHSETFLRHHERTQKKKSRLHSKHVFIRGSDRFGGCLCHWGNVDLLTSFMRPLSSAEDLLCFYLRWFVPGDVADDVHLPIFGTGAGESLLRRATEQG